MHERKRKQTKITCRLSQALISVFYVHNVYILRSAEPSWQFAVRSIKEAD
ncbi:hypothetical protein KP509_18G067300 [Ceratopteris richardii]|uniref:Uncharacterized protein n=1 Tax=Ceratopteris richardii TaxID=49495 RepID=A0A8T2SSG8_CERRI|nr:hypothetical protein KP509_18G067300 [Ceratopteris richardii]